MSFLKKSSGYHQKRQDMTRQQQDEYLASLNNPDSHADELATVIRLLFLPLAALWVWYLGYIYTFEQLTGLVSPLSVTILAVSIPLAVQIIKLYAAKKVLSAWLFGWYDSEDDHDWFPLAFWITSTLLVLGAFAWSFKISMWDASSTVQRQYKDDNRPSLTQMVNEATASIDNQIAAIDQQNNTAETMKGRNGKVKWEGREIMRTNSATLTALQKQRATLVDQTTKNYQADTANAEANAVEKGNFFTRFGGFGEAAECLFLLLLGFVRGMNRNSHLRAIKKAESDATTRQQAQNMGAHHPTGPAFNPFQYRGNNGPHNHARNPIGFHITHTPQATYNAPSVPQTPQPVAQINTVGSDEILISCRKALQSDLSNFHAKYQQPSSVSARINSALDKCLEAMKAPGFSPSRSEAIRFWDYVTGKVFHKLNSVGWPYEKQQEFEKTALQSIPKEVNQYDLT